MRRFRITTIGDTTFYEAWFLRTLFCLSVTRWRCVQFTRSRVGVTLEEYNGESRQN